jgi:hypothetical protein
MIVEQREAPSQSNSVDSAPMVASIAGSPPGAKDTPSLAAIVASALPQARLPKRARALRRLLMPVGPLALAVLAGGAFAKCAASTRWARISVSLEDAANVTASQIFELVRYVEQSDPTVLEQVMEVLSHDTTTMAALGSSVAVLLLQLRSSRKAKTRSGGGPRT